MCRIAVSRIAVCVPRRRVPMGCEEGGACVAARTCSVKRHDRAGACGARARHHCGEGGRARHAGDAACRRRGVRTCGGGGRVRRGSDAARRWRAADVLGRPAVWAGQSARGLTGRQSPGAVWLPSRADRKPEPESGNKKGRKGKGGRKAAG